MLNTIDKWILRKYVPMACKLAQDDFERLYQRWKYITGWRRLARLANVALMAAIFITIAAVGVSNWGFVVAIALLIFGGVFTSWWEGRCARVFVEIWFDEQHCVHCGYGLRGTTTVGGAVCPECGERIVAFDEFVNRTQP